MAHMFDAATQCTDVPPADPTWIDAADAIAASVRRAERRLRVLEEVTAIGLDLTRALHRRVQASEPVGAEAPGADTGICEFAEYQPQAPSPRPPLPPIDPAAAFARLSRAVRLTLQLEAKADEALRALIAGGAQAVEARREATRRQGEAPEAERREPAHEHAHVHDEVDRPATESADREVETDGQGARLWAALEERLEDDAAHEGNEDRPIRETAEALCHDLDLHPGVSPVTGEGRDRPPGAPPPRPRGPAFNHPSNNAARRPCGSGDGAAQGRAPDPAARPPPPTPHPARRE